MIWDVVDGVEEGVRGGVFLVALKTCLKGCNKSTSVLLSSMQELIQITHKGKASLS